MSYSATQPADTPATAPSPATGEADCAHNAQIDAPPIMPDDQTRSTLSKAEVADAIPWGKLPDRFPVPYALLLLCIVQTKTVPEALAKYAPLMPDAPISLRNAYDVRLRHAPQLRIIRAHYLDTVIAHEARDGLAAGVKRISASLHALPERLSPADMGKLAPVLGKLHEFTQAARQDKLLDAPTTRDIEAVESTLLRLTSGETVRHNSK